MKQIDPFIMNGNSPTTTLTQDTGPVLRDKSYRNHLVVVIGEFAGTFLFLLFAFTATQVANMSVDSKTINLSASLYISLAFGFSLAVNAWAFFRVSGGLFNPAASLSAYHITFAVANAKL